MKHGKERKRKLKEEERETPGTLKHLTNLSLTPSLTAAKVAVSGGPNPNTIPVSTEPIVAAGSHSRKGRGESRRMTALSPPPYLLVLPHCHSLIY